METIPPQSIFVFGFNYSRHQSIRVLIEILDILLLIQDLSKQYIPSIYFKVSLDFCYFHWSVILILSVCTLVLLMMVPQFCLYNSHDPRVRPLESFVYCHRELLFVILNKTGCMQRLLNSLLLKCQQQNFIQKMKYFRV